MVIYCFVISEMGKMVFIILFMVFNILFIVLILFCVLLFLSWILHVLF